MCWNTLLDDDQRWKQKKHFQYASYGGVDVDDDDDDDGWSD